MFRVPRLLSLPQKRSLFLFGPRNTGKSTLVEQQYPSQSSLFINLLENKEEDRFSRAPDALHQIVHALPKTTTHVILDEVQKVPRLLDVVQLLMKETDKHFIMTGSSARKLKRGGANLLAGRAFVYHLFPLTSIELGDQFDLDSALQWGTLPEIFISHDDIERREFLNAYSLTYLKEEVWGEQLVRKLDPFRRFLEVAAQCNGKILNFSNIARDVGVDDKTIGSYYSILEDTLLGFHLEPFHNSVRKRLSQKPKFYFFDTGVVRALSRLMNVPITPSTHAYGNAFEHFIILECMRLADYYRLDFRFTYLRTPSDAEIDLIVERPGQPLLCIEIKSATTVVESDLSVFDRLCQDMLPCETICLSNEQYPKKILGVMVLPWQQGIRQYFSKSVDE
jgi:uncharacterized protein